MDLVTRLNLIANRPGWRWLTKKTSELLWIERCVIMVVNLESWEPPSLKPIPFSVAFALGSEIDVHEINTDQRLDSMLEAEHNLGMIRAGHTLFLARCEDEVVFYGWCVTGRKSALDHFFTMKRDEFIVARVYTREDYRGYNLYARGLSFIIPIMVGRGYQRAFVDIASHNLPSIVSAAKVGFTMLDADYFLLRVLFRQYLIPAGCLKHRFLKKAYLKDRI